MLQTIPSLTETSSDDEPQKSLPQQMLTQAVNSVIDAIQLEILKLLH